jgi:hypothetical protein
MLHYDCRYLSEDTVKKLTGSPLAVWPSPTTREELIHGLRLEVLAAGNRRLARGQEAAALNSALDALRKVAAAKGEMAGAGMDFEAMTFVQPILRLADVRGPAREAVKPMQQAAAAAPPIGGMPTPPVLPQGSQPTPGALPG